MDIWMILLIVAAGVAALFLLGIGITFVVGMFFVRLAVGRKKAWDNSLIPRAEREQPKKYPQRQKIIDQNEVRIRGENRQLLAKAREEDWQVNAEDGVSLVAKAYRQDGHRWVILVHGYMCTWRDMMDYSGMYLKEGFSLLVPDQRAHGRSGGKYTGMGWLERRDMVCWIREILQQDPQAEIVLHGVSMGAATVMMTAGEALPDNVKAVVEDCGYASVERIFRDELKTIFRLPAFPLLHQASWVAKLVAGYDFREASSVEQLKKTKLPVLFIHGSMDAFVQPYMQDLCFAAAAGEKEYLRVEDASHTQAYARQPEEYREKVLGFVEKYLTPEKVSVT